MQQRDGSFLFSPSDLNHFLECEHLTALDLEVARGELARPALDDPQRDLIARKGDEHEAQYLASLRADGENIATIELGDDWDLERGAADTLAAMRSGVDVVYQAVFLDSAGWRGFADFLERVDTPSELGDFSYEVADTKLARHSKPYFILQLCFYSEQVRRIQGSSRARCTSSAAPACASPSTNAPPRPPRMARTEGAPPRGVREPADRSHRGLRGCR